MKSIVSYIKESEGFSEQEYEKLKNELIKYKFNFGCIDDRRLIQIWQDEMDLDYRYLTLIEIGFTGLVHEDSLDEFGEVSVNGGSVSHGLGMFCEDMSNNFAYEWNYNRTWTLGYKDSSIITIDGYGEEDYKALRGLTKNQMYRTQENIIKRNVNAKNLLFLYMQDADSEPLYFVRNTEGLEMLKKWGEFEEWKDGRGEKKLDYIQDDYHLIYSD